VSEPQIIVDTGPLFAALVERDQHHAWARAQFASLPPPFLTCEPVLAELFYLVQHHPNGVSGFFKLLERDLLLIELDVLAERQALAQLVRKYRNLPMSLADACLVRISEQHNKAAVLTVDSHFRIYRRNGRQQIPLLMPS
jgi:predicted nucleic acid-binding protein